MGASMDDVTALTAKEKTFEKREMKYVKVLFI